MEVSDRKGLALKGLSPETYMIAEVNPVHIWEDYTMLSVRVSLT